MSDTKDTSLFERLGGMAAVDAAVNKFYIKVLADKRISRFFTSTDMIQMHAKQKAFLSYVFGGPVNYEGKDMRAAHARMRLKEIHFNAVAEHLEATLIELKVPKNLIQEVMTIAASTKKEVLNR